MKFHQSEISEKKRAAIGRERAVDISKTQFKYILKS